MPKSDFKINVSSGTSFDMDAESSYGDLIFSEYQHINMTEDGAHREAEGYVGSSNSGNRIRARLRYGNLKMW